MRLCLEQLLPLKKNIHKNYSQSESSSLRSIFVSGFGGGGIIDDMLSIKFELGATVAAGLADCDPSLAPEIPLRRIANFL